MTPLVPIVADLVGITVLVFGVYLRCHHRRDLILAYTALNVGVMAVATVLAGSGAGIGLGLGLFGVLSIIRLRSDAISQEEVAYYFIALAMGLVNGLSPSPVWLGPVVTGLLVAMMFVVDNPRVAPRLRRQVITLDRAYPNEPELRQALAHLLGAQILQATVSELDLVRDTTIVDVRFRVPRWDADALQSSRLPSAMVGAR